MINLNDLKTVSKEEVKRLINAASNYYTGLPTGMSDFEYDGLMQRIQVENPSFSIFDYIVYGEDSSKGVHPLRVPTFDKVNFNELTKTAVDETMSITPKYDGCSIVAYYTNGELKNILTRSNEVTGVVQTNKLRHKVPGTVDSSIIAILFEAVVSTNRAKANGLINSKYKQDEVDELLTLRPFDCILKGRVLGYKARMDLTGLEYTTLTIQEAMSLNAQGDEPTLNGLPVDGVVVYSNVNPTFGKIFKFYSTSNKTTIVKRLTFNPSKNTGIINIGVELEPVKIGAITIRNVGNIGSWQTVLNKRIGTGSEVSVTLTKVTIPMITSNTPCTVKPTPTCPWCGMDLEEFQGKLICVNENCTFWEDYFATRYFNIMREYMGTEWVDEFTVNGPFGATMLASAELQTHYLFANFLTKPEYLLYLVKPPRLSSEKYEIIKTRLQQHFGEACTSLNKMVDLIKNSVPSTNQREYVLMIWDKLSYFIYKLKAIRSTLKKPAEF